MPPRRRRYSPIGNQAQKNKIELECLQEGGERIKAAIRLVMCLALFSVIHSAKGHEAPADFQAPQGITTVEPAYPASVVIGGTVVLKVRVSSSGEFQDVQVLREASGFEQLAIETVKKREFAAAAFDGKPVTASLPVAFSFSQPIVWWGRQGK